MSATSAIIKEIGENDSNQKVSGWLSTGILPLNYAMSGRYDGGFPIGRITEVYGASSCGKTLLATMAMIETQKKGGVAVLMDFEHSFSIDRAEKLGMSSDIGNWIYKQPETAEQGFKWIAGACKSMREGHPNTLLTIVVDSTASMVTAAEEKAGFEDGNMKTRLSLATFMSTGLKMLAGIVSKSNVTMIFLNQTRDNPGVMFGDKETTPGGNAQKFYASLRLRLRKYDKVKDGEGKDADIIGENIVAMTIKNKVYRPFVETDYVSSFADGVDLVATHINALNKQGLLGSTKGWVEFYGKKMRAAELISICREDPAAYEKLLELFTAPKIEPEATE